MRAPTVAMLDLEKGAASWALVHRLNICHGGECHGQQVRGGHPIVRSGCWRRGSLVGQLRSDDCENPRFVGRRILKCRAAAFVADRPLLFSLMNALFGGQCRVSPGQTA